VDIERDGDDEAVEDKEKEDEEEDDEEEEEHEDDEDDEDDDEDDGKECWTIGHREMVNTSADNQDMMVDDQARVQPEQAQGMGAHTPWSQPPAHSPQRQTS